MYVAIGGAVVVGVVVIVGVVLWQRRQDEESRSQMTGDIGVGPPSMYAPPTPAVPASPYYNAPVTQNTLAPTTTIATPADQSCGCSDIHMPVCVNGITFHNPCKATCYGLSGYVNGACISGGSGGGSGTLSPAPPPPAQPPLTTGTTACGVCPPDIRPVCANGRQSVINACTARCFGYTSITDGKCKVKKLRHWRYPGYGHGHSHWGKQKRSKHKQSGDYYYR